MLARRSIKLINWALSAVFRADYFGIQPDGAHLLRLERLLGLAELVFVIVLVVGQITLGCWVIPAILGEGCWHCQGDWQYWAEHLMCPVWRDWPAYW